MPYFVLPIEYHKSQPLHLKTCHKEHFVKICTLFSLLCRLATRRYAHYDRTWLWLDIMRLNNISLVQVTRCPDMLWDVDRQHVEIKQPVVQDGLTELQAVCRQTARCSDFIQDIVTKLWDMFDKHTHCMMSWHTIRSLRLSYIWQIWQGLRHYDVIT